MEVLTKEREEWNSKNRILEDHMQMMDFYIVYERDIMFKLGTHALLLFPKKLVATVGCAVTRNA